MIMKKFVIFLLVITVMVHGSTAGDAMKFLASGFLKVIEECKKELNTDDHMITDLYHYWKLEYSLLDRATGCAILCMSKKLKLMDDRGKIHHGNAEEFAKKHGAEDTLAHDMVTIIHGCEDQHQDVGDQCLRTLAVATCFRTGVRSLRWETTVDAIFTDVLTEIST